MLGRICVQSIWIILLLWSKYSALLQHRQNWWQPPLPATRHPSISNGGDIVPEPANIGTSIPSPSQPCPILSVHPIRPVASHFLHTSQHIKIQFLQVIPINLIQIWSSRYDPDSRLKGTPNKPPIMHPMKTIVPKTPRDTSTYYKYQA